MMLDADRYSVVGPVDGTDEAVRTKLRCGGLKLVAEIWESRLQLFILLKSAGATLVTAESVACWTTAPTSRSLFARSLRLVNFSLQL